MFLNNKILKFIKNIYSRELSNEPNCNAERKVPTGCLSLFGISVEFLLIRLILIYCFNYAFLPWPLFLHVSLEIVVWSPKWKEAKPSVFVIPDLYDVVNPSRHQKSNQDFLLNFLLSFLKGKKVCPRGFLWYPDLVSVCWADPYLDNDLLCVVRGSCFQFFYHGR